MPSGVEHLCYGSTDAGGGLAVAIIDAVRR